jgi:hypothetical protein
MTPKERSEKAEQLIIQTQILNRKFRIMGVSVSPATDEDYKQEAEEAMRGCCDIMTSQLKYSCEQHPLRCPDLVVSRSDKNEFFLHAHNATYTCQYCPWCGAKMAASEIVKYPTYVVRYGISSQKDFGVNYSAALKYYEGAGPRAKLIQSLRWMNETKTIKEKTE